MQLTAINCIFLACAATALASEPRPKRHLHKIKEIIADTLFGASESNSTESPPSDPETKYFKIPGFDDVVIKAVPKGSAIEPLPIIEKLPPNSQIGIIGSYLGTNSLNDTYNALLGVKNLMTSGILNTNHGTIEDLLQPTKAKHIMPSKPVKPCARPEIIGAPAIQPVRIIVKPPKVPAVLPTQYSYKQINRDGSLTTYTSSLDLSQGVKVIEEGKTLPFFIDRVRKIPVQLPVPVLPDVSKIVTPTAFEVSYGPYPIEFIHPGTSYSYKQMHHDGKLTTYSGLPSLNGNHNGPVVVTETGTKIPPPPFFLVDRIEKVAATASYPKVPFIDFIQTKPMAIDVPAGHVVYSAPVGGPVPLPPPNAYSYTQLYGNGGKTSTHLGAADLIPAVTVTEHKFPPPPFNPFPRPAISPGPVILGEQPVPVFQGMPPAPNSFSYKQVENGKVTTYTGSGIAEENVSPAVIAQHVSHPIPPPHLTERIEKVAAGAWFNRPPLVSSPIVRPFAFPVPPGSIQVPSMLPITPQRPVKLPSASGTSPFLYKHIHKDGSVTRFGEDSFINAGHKNQSPEPMTAPPNPQRVFESPIYTGPFPMDVNPNAIKPSTPVSGSYSYKLVNNGQLNNEDMRPIQGDHNVAPQIIENNMPFPVPPVVPIVPAPVQGCVDPEIINPNVGPAVMFDGPVPLSYTYKQISHSNPDPFVVVNVEDPVGDANTVNMHLSENSPVQPPQAFPVPNDHNQNGYVFVPQSAADTHIPQPPQVLSETPRSSFSYKQVTNQGLYDYSDEFASGVRTNQPPMMKPEERPIEDVHTKKVTLPPRPNPVLNNRNSLTNNPIIVPEHSDPIAAPEQTFSFKQSNADGSSITTVKDGQNSLSVKVEEPSKSETAPEEAPRVNSNLEEVSQAPSLVPNPVEEATSTVAAPKRKQRRRIIKRVKNRGDIPEVE